MYDVKIKLQDVHVVKVLKKTQTQSKIDIPTRFSINNNNVWSAMLMYKLLNHNRTIGVCGDNQYI